MYISESFFVVVKKEKKVQEQDWCNEYIFVWVAEKAMETDELRTSRRDNAENTFVSGCYPWF